MHVKASNITSLVCFEKFQILVWEIAIYYKKYYLAENLAALFFYLAESSRILLSFQPNLPTSSWHHWSHPRHWFSASFLFSRTKAFDVALMTQSQIKKRNLFMQFFTHYRHFFPTWLLYSVHWINAVLYQLSLRSLFNICL